MITRRNEIRTNKMHLRVGDRCTSDGRPVAKVCRKDKEDTMSSLEFAAGVYDNQVVMVTIHFADGSVRDEYPRAASM